MAELALVGVYGAGPQALARRDRVIDSLAAMLAPGFEENPSAPAVSAEAIAATVYALMREQVRSAGPREPRRGGAARHLHHPGHLRRPRAGPRGRQRRGQLEALAGEVGRRRDVELLLGGLGAEVGKDRRVHQLGDLLLPQPQFSFGDAPPGCGRRRRRRRRSRWRARATPGRPASDEPSSSRLTRRLKVSWKSSWARLPAYWTSTAARRATRSSARR